MPETAKEYVDLIVGSLASHIKEITALVPGFEVNIILVSPTNPRAHLIAGPSGEDGIIKACTDLLANPNTIHGTGGPEGVRDLDQPTKRVIQ